MVIKDPVRNIVNQTALPEGFPTHAHESEFWESLGRTVATFGFLEEVLLKAIFAFTATTEYSEDEIEEAYSKWVPKLERSLSDQLGSLIDTYGKSVRDNLSATIENLDVLLNDLRAASKIRNVLCHGSWRMPDSNGKSVPFFVNRQKEIFETPIDVSFLNQVQKHAVELTCAVINTVTHMGWQFPSCNGVGEPVWS
ncbi:MAG: hypothetical protein HWD86_00630 [Kangiellaceae bacterium]|nr:hypothetical protein [Kangiellaceae bacterium]